MADSDIKGITEALPGESFETTAFTTPPPLDQATVVDVTDLCSPSVDGNRN